MMVLFLGMGAMIGATLPMAISDWLPRNPYQWGSGSSGTKSAFQLMASQIPRLTRGLQVID